MSTKIFVSYELTIDGEVGAERLHRIEASIAAMLRLGRNNFDKLVVKKDRAVVAFFDGSRDGPMFTTGGYIPSPRKEEGHGTA